MGCDEETAVSVVFVSDRKIHEFNRDFRDKNMPTDVLSFPGGGEDVHGDPGYLGDVIISVETATRQAKEQDVSLDEELLRLLVHGLLHLKGYIHDTPARARKMRARENELIDLVQQDT